MSDTCGMPGVPLKLIFRPRRTPQENSSGDLLASWVSECCSEHLGGKCQAGQGGGPDPLPNRMGAAATDTGRRSPSSNAAPASWPDRGPRRGPFFGREQECGAILTAAASDDPRVVLINGLAGVGKSRLLEETARLAHMPVLAA